MILPGVRGIQRFRLTNDDTHALEVWLEPLGDKVHVLPNATMEFVASDAEFDCVHFVHSGNGVAIHGNVVSVSAVLKDDVLDEVWRMPE